MSVKKRGNFFYMYFNFYGQKVQQSTKCTNRRDAEEYEIGYRNLLAKGEVGIGKRKKMPRFKEALKEFLEWSEVEHMAKLNTLRRIQTAMKPILAFFEYKRLDQISVPDVEDYKRWRIKQKKLAPKKKLLKNKKATTNKVIKPATVNKELACLRSMINYFIRNDILVKNPVSRVKFLREDNEHTRVLSREEERLYLMACSQPLKDVAIIMLETGMRPDEVCRTEVRNVDLEKNFIFIPDGKTKASRRRIPLSKKAKEVLISRLIKPEGDYVFPGMKTARDANTHIIKLNNAHRGTLKRSKIEPFRIYDLRHTFATRAAEAGVDLITLASLLGHSRVQMVMRYAHPTEEHQINAIRKMEMAFSRAA
jgi:integrase